MSFINIYVIVILLTAVLEVIAQDERCGIHNSDDQYPWLVGIEFENPYMRRLVSICTGALIDRKLVVSNAQCFNMDIQAKFVRFGPINNITAQRCSTETREECADETIRIPIEVVIQYPEYAPNVEWSTQDVAYHDIALVKLRAAVTYTKFIQPICLPSIDVTRFAARDLELYFTGIYQNGPSEYIRENNGAPMTYVDEYQHMRKPIPIGKDQICAKHVRQLTDIRLCFTIGGILVNKIGNRYELVGLFDIKSQCENAKLFTNVFLYVNWIRKEMPYVTSCGRRKVLHVELIMNGEETKAGDWPWHVAIYRFKKSAFKYICGGTLISKTMVLTAAHCVTVSGIPVSPDILSVALGKYYLIGANIQPQELEVQTVISHEDYSPKNYFHNDIALLKLKGEAIYSNYIQPVCIWSSVNYEPLHSNSDFGMVVGWGYDQSEATSSQLKQINIPRVSYATCVLKNPVFYVNVLSNEKKFCAGWANGTSPCNGDSGGGFLEFIPDKSEKNSSNAMGSWYIRGIISIGISLRNNARCDPNEYVVFTDVGKYIDWIMTHFVN